MHKNDKPNVMAQNESERTQEEPPTRVSKPGSSDIDQYENIDVIPQRDVTQKDLYQSGENPEGWLLYGNNYRRHHHTTADIITPENVSELSLEWKIDPVPKASPSAVFQGSPIVVPGDPPIIYQVNGPEQTRAINARTGDVLWYHEYHPKSPVLSSGPPANRGVGVLGDTVYKGTLDYGVLALNRYTGGEKWYYNGAYKYRGETAEGPAPLAVHNELGLFQRDLGSSSNYPMIIFEDGMVMGTHGGEYGVRGWAERVTTDGEQMWLQGMTPHDQWIGDSWKHGGATVWQANAIDPESGTVIIPTSNPGPWFGTVRPGWNPYSAGKVALDVESGEVEWNYQEVPHDWWDYDSPSPAIIYETEVEGEQRTLASWPGKTGWVFTADLETGKLIGRSDEFVEHINTWTFPAQTFEEAEWLAPNLSGGTDPQPSTYDPERNTMVVKGLNQPMKMNWNYVEYEVGEPYVGMKTIHASGKQRKSIPKWDKPIGNITAMDPVTGEIKWQDWLEEPPWGGAMTTTTGLTFAGTGLTNGKFIAYDTETGDRLWTDSFDMGVEGNPVSWIDPKTSKQYVYIQAGRKAEPNRIAVYSLGGNQ